jgi:serine/threonine protein phosphatase 1
VRLYAIGDIHGRADLLTQLHRMILADAASHATNQRLIAIHLGDYVDRGPQGSDVIELLSGVVLPGFETVFLKGNHEQLMLEYLDGGDGKIWFHNGGETTAESYGVAPLEADLWGDGATDTRAALRHMVPDKHIRFLNGLALSARYGDYYFAHAGIDPAIPLDDQSERDLLWIRDRFLTSTDDHGVVVVHGHSIARTVDIRPNRIGIDTGASYSGVLTALVLQDDQQSLLQTGVSA